MSIKLQANSNIMSKQALFTLAIKIKLGKIFPKGLKCKKSDNYERNQDAYGVRKHEATGSNQSVGLNSSL